MNAMSSNVIKSPFQKLPEFKGKKRLARLYHKNLIARACDVIVGGKDKLEYKIPNLKETIGEEIFINGVYEEEIISLIIESLAPGEVFLDLGANIGAIALAVSKKTGGKNPIVCVEASLKLYEYLSFNIRHNNLNNILALHFALSDIDDMELSFYSPDDKFGKGSLSPVFTKQAQLVKSIRLDTLLERNGIGKVGVIKIDVEGYEYHVFNGAKRLLEAKNAPKIVFEFVDWAENQAEGLKAGMAQQCLVDYGYKLFEIQTGAGGFSLSEVEKVVTEGSKMFFAAK